MVSKNGNLLLNVGPRGVDAQIPDEQRLRLHVAGGVDGHQRDGGARDAPVGPARATRRSRASAVRYTARDEDVFAISSTATAVVTFPDLAPTPTTDVTTIAGSALACAGRDRRRAAGRARTATTRRRRRRSWCAAVDVVATPAP